MTDRPSDPHDVEIRDSVPSGLAVSSDQPYRILVVADLAGSASGSVSGPVHDGVVGLSAESFDDLMAAAQPSVTLKMTDPLSSAGAMVEVSLRFDSLKGFNPSAVAEQIPSVQALTKARAMIVERMRGKTSSQALAEGIAAVVAADAELTWADRIAPLVAERAGADFRRGGGSAGPDRFRRWGRGGICCSAEVSDRGGSGCRRRWGGEHLGQRGVGDAPHVGGDRPAGVHLADGGVARARGARD